MNDNFSSLQFQKTGLEKTGDRRLLGLFLQFSSSPLPFRRWGLEWSGDRAFFDWRDLGPETKQYVAGAHGTNQHTRGVASGATPLDRFTATARATSKAERPIRAAAQRGEALRGEAHNIEGTSLDRAKGWTRCSMLRCSCGLNSQAFSSAPTC